MAGCDAEQRECRTFGCPSILLPVSEGVHADPQRFSEVRLRQADEAPQGCDVARLELATHDALPLAPTERSGEVGSGQFCLELQVSISMYST